MHHDFEVLQVGGGSQSRHDAEVFDPTTGRVADATPCYASADDAARAGKDLCAQMDAQRPARLRALAVLANERITHA